MKAIIKLLFSLIFLVGLYNNSFAVPYNPPQPKVYDGCGLPNFRTTTHNTYYFDIVNGNDSTGNGTQATPWQHPNAIFHLTNGLGPLLGSTIHAGDVVLLENGNYGVLQPGSSGSATNQTNFLTIAADLGQVNVSFSNITIQNITKLYIQGITVHSLGTGSNATDSLISLAEQGSTLGYTTQDIIINETNLYSQADVSTWTTSQWLSNGNNGIMGFQSAPGNMKCVAIENSNIYNIIGGIQILAGNVLLYNNNIYQTGEFAIDACGINGQIQKNLIHDGNSLGAGDVVTGQTTTNCSNWDIFNNFIWKATATGSIYYLPILYDGIINLDSDITKVKIHNNLVITDASLGIGGSSLHSSSLFQNTILQDGTTSSNGNPALWVGSIATGATLPSSNTSAYNNFIPALGNSDQPFYNIGSGVSANNNLLPYNSGGVVITDYNSSSIVETLAGTSGSATNYTQAFSGGVNKVDKSGGYTNQIQSYDPVHFGFNLRAVNGSFLKSMNVGANGYGSISASILPKPGCFPDGNCPLPLVSQTITFPTLSNSVLGGSAPTPAATASSGLSVSYSSLTSSICTISGTTITMIQTGTCTIQATQTGNTQYAAATPVNQSFTISSTGTGITFTPLHTYFLANAASGGSDSNNGLTPTTPWLTPRHNVVCGDVIIAKNGAYDSNNFDFWNSNPSLFWGTVSGCPSNSGGIDGNGQIYLAVLVCQTFQGCTINSTSQNSMNVNKSNWAVEGFLATDTATPYGTCFVANPGTYQTGGTPINYIAFINNVGHDCEEAAFYAAANSGSQQSAALSVDQFALVGNVAYNSSGTSGVCGSGMGDVVPVNVNNSTDTHVFMSQNFSFGNINGFCGPNSNGSGDFQTLTANVGSGATIVPVSNTSNSAWSADWPITSQTSNGLEGTAIPTHTRVVSKSGNNVTMSQATVASIASGQNITVAVTTDGEGINFDTWDANGFTGKAIVKNNVLWGNGNSGFELFCPSDCNSSLVVKVYNNTFYGNVADWKRQNPSAEIFINADGAHSNPGTLSITNNIAKAAWVKPPNSLTSSNALTGQQVVGFSAGTPTAGSITFSGNWIKSFTGVTCPIFAICDTGNNMAQYNSGSFTFGTGNTLSDPGLTNPSALPLSVNCSGYLNVVDCMNNGYGIAAKIATTIAPTTLGYQAPGACTADPDYPAWLKGVAYLSVSGFVANPVIQEMPGLVTKPCNY